MKPVLLLHGALGAADQWQPLANLLAENFAVHSLNFSGHGGNAMAGDFSIQRFAGEVLQWLKENGLSSVNLIGYSMGGYVAMYLAAHHPEAVASVVTLGTKYRWDEATAAKETAMLDPEKMEAKVPAFAEQLRQRHQPNDWKTVVTNTAAMLRQMGAAPPLKAEDFGRITAKVLLLLGDRDKMVSLDETVSVYKSLSSASFGILPNTHHAIEQTDAELLAFLVKRFLR